MREQVFEGRHFCELSCFFGSGVSEKGNWGFREGFFSFLLLYIYFLNY